MLNSFLPQYSPELAHPLFASIIGLLEFFHFLIEPFEVVIFCHKDLGTAINLASEVRDCSFPSFHVQTGFFARLSPQPCPHGSSPLAFPSVILGQFPFFSHLSGVTAGVHLFRSVFVAIVVETMLPARDFALGPSDPSSTRLLECPVLSWVCFHFWSPVVTMGDAWLPQSPGKLWVPVPA